MSYIRRRERHCRNCECLIITRKKAYFYCSRHCYLEYHETHGRMPLFQLNILLALEESEGIRWMPKGSTLHSMAYHRYKPLLEIIEEKLVGTGKSSDYLTRLTSAGWHWVEELRLYDEEKAI